MKWRSWSFGEYLINKNSAETAENIASLPVGPGHGVQKSQYFVIARLINTYRVLPFTRFTGKADPLGMTRQHYDTMGTRTGSGHQTFNNLLHKCFMLWSQNLKFEFKVRVEVGPRQC